MVKHFPIASITNNITFSHLLTTPFIHFLNSGIEVKLSPLIWLWKKQNKVIISNSSPELLSAFMYAYFQSIVNSLQNQSMLPHLNIPWASPILKKHGPVFIIHPQNFSLCKATITRQRKKQAYSTFLFWIKILEIGSSHLFKPSSILISVKVPENNEQTILTKAPNLFPACHPSDMFLWHVSSSAVPFVPFLEPHALCY